MKLLLLLLCTIVDTFVSPVYTVLPGTYQLFNCPYNTPLHYITSNYTSTDKIYTIRLKCADTDITFTQCDNLFSTQIDSQSSNRTTSCQSDCFISGVLLYNRNISHFLCSAISDTTTQQLINCSWSNYNIDVTNIGDITLNNNSVISELNAIIKTYQHSSVQINWKHKKCFLSKDLCSITNTTVVNIEHFNALNINNTNWQFTCNNGYKLIGPHEFNCIENASYYLNDNCQDCCSPLNIKDVLTKCNNDNMTLLYCENGFYLNGPAAVCSVQLENEDHTYTCEACNTTINMCSSCDRNIDNEVICTNCTNPNGYPTTLTKTQKKCKILAKVQSLLVKRTINNWIISCYITGSPKVNTTIYLNQTLRITVKQKKTIMIEPILPYSIKEVTCIAMNSWGTDTQSIILSLPSIVFDRNQIYTVNVGTSIVMDCVINGDIDSWIWFVDNQQILTTNDKYTLLSNTSLAIDYADVSYQRIYSCIVTNPIQHVIIYKTIHCYTDDVFQPGHLPNETASIIDWIDKYEGTVGSTITLNCEATGYPVPVMAWSRNGRLLVVTGTMEEYEMSNETSLYLYNVSNNDEGEYDCIVSNIFGSESKTTNVFIYELSPPLQTQVSQLSQVTHLSSLSPVTHLSSLSPVTHLSSLSPITHLSSLSPVTHLSSLTQATQLSPVTHLLSLSPSPVTQSLSPSPVTQSQVSPHVPSLLTLSSDTTHIIPISTDTTLDKCRPSCILGIHLLLTYILFLLMALFLCLIKIKLKFY